MRILLTAALMLTLAACQTTSGNKTVRGQDMGEKTEQVIILEESDLLLPPRPKLSIRQIKATDFTSGRHTEDFHLTNGFVKFERVYGFNGFSLPPESDFRKVLRTARWEGLYLPVDEMTFRRESDLTYAGFRHKGRPCIVFSSLVGKTVGGIPPLREGLLSGWYCDPRENADPDALLGEMVSYIRKIDLR